MKKKIFSAIALLLGIVMVFAMAGCASQGSSSTGDSADGAKAENLGAIMYLSAQANGHFYDRTEAYLKAICEKLGYKLNIVLGDTYNDAANNLQAVRNAMTDDTKGLIVALDGGVESIMEAYPDLYVAGFATDMNSVYASDGTQKALLDNPKFLGTIVDGYADGTKLGQLYFDHCVEKGYRRIGVVSFPGYAYPNLAAATDKFVELAEKHNKTAADGDKFDIVENADGSKVTVLQFSSIEDSYFTSHTDLDAIVGCCAGNTFIYPQLKSAISNNTCSKKTKLVSGGFEADDALVGDIGGDGCISMLQFSPNENPAFAIVLLDNAITGNLFDDQKNDRVDSIKYIIQSEEDVENVKTKSFCWTGDLSKAALPVDTVVNTLCKRNNSSATYAQLIEAIHSDDLTVEALKNK